MTAEESSRVEHNQVAELVRTCIQEGAPAAAQKAAALVGSTVEEIISIDERMDTIIEAACVIGRSIDTRLDEHDVYGLQRAAGVAWGSQDSKGFTLCHRLMLHPDAEDMLETFQDLLNEYGSSQDALSRDNESGLPALLLLMATKPSRLDDLADLLWETIFVEGTGQYYETHVQANGGRDRPIHYGNTLFEIILNYYSSNDVAIDNELKDILQSDYWRSDDHSLSRAVGLALSQSAPDQSIVNLVSDATQIGLPLRSGPDEQSVVARMIDALAHEFGAEAKLCISGEVAWLGMVESTLAACPDAFPESLDSSYYETEAVQTLLTRGSDPIREWIAGRQSVALALADAAPKWPDSAPALPSL